MLRSAFHMGHMATKMEMVPSGRGDGSFQILVATDSGALGLISPVDEQVYRRLLVLQNFMISAAEPLCGLNPRGFRVVEGSGGYGGYGGSGGGGGGGGG